MSEEKPKSHWLEVVGGWLVAPAKAVLRPWWKKLVEDKAEAVTVKNRLLEAVVRFRVVDFARKHKLDEDTQSGLAGRVIGRLKGSLPNLTSESLSSPPFLAKVEREIELTGLRSETWAKLACLAGLEQFDPRMYITVEFTQSNGSQSHSTTMIAAFQGEFLFVPLLAMSEIGQARLSPQVLELLKEYCGRNTLPLIKFEVLPAHDGMFQGFGQMTNPTTIPEGWKPS